LDGRSRHEERDHLNPVREVCERKVTPQKNCRLAPFFVIEPIPGSDTTSTVVRSCI